MNEHETRIDMLSRYFEGPVNKFSRFWLYLQRGNGLANEFKSYAYVFVGLYVGTPYLQNHWLVAGAVFLGIMSVVVPLLILLGRWHIQRVEPANAYLLATKSPFGTKPVEAAIATAQHLKEIKEWIVSK